MRQISHSGHTFTSLGIKNGNTVWPIKEYLVRRKHSKNVAERIDRLNPNGKEEGEGPRGYYPEFLRRPWGITFDAIGKLEFIQKYGRKAFQRLPKNALIRNGKRIGVPMYLVVKASS